ncbi:MAG: ribosomal RNA small subunit methyltransferase A [Candidatus Harrisonbacteria bacterium]|nr:ribosomal RNA small subunit methyltransferase A [Candidatus Harrisonbacteria bacterium]
MREKLGQHFLINKKAISKIIVALDLQKNDTVVEIGPGEGALTLPLAEKCQNPNSECQIIAVEKDKTLARELAMKLPQIKMLEGDILKLLPQLVIDLSLEIGHLKLVGNIPYYITGKLLRILGELDRKPGTIVLTIQREVAERLCERPPKMNLLAASVQIWAKPEIIGRLAPSDFSPPPEVRSAIIKLESRIQNLESKASNDYYKLIKALFKQPRKTVLNNLSTGLGITKAKTLELLKKAGLNGDERPQNLDLGVLIELSTLISK